MYEKLLTLLKTMAGQVQVPRRILNGPLKHKPHYLVSASAGGCVVSTAAEAALWSLAGKEQEDGAHAIRFHEKVQRKHF